MDVTEATEHVKVEDEGEGMAAVPAAETVAEGDGRLSSFSSLGFQLSAR